MSWPEGIRATAKYLSRSEVRSALHATENKNQPWNECAQNINQNFFKESPYAATVIVMQLTVVLSRYS
jgi:hypothetical protein